jgi:hypothetical protein
MGYMNEATSTTELDRLIARRDWALGRLENAKRIGKPGHIARCQQRYEGLAAIVEAVSAR